jgi:GT2 family glycosyltransferase
MHEQVQDFLRRTRERWAAVGEARRIVECGAFIVNGSPREVFGEGTEEYVGVDWRPGPGVDAVALVHEYRGRPDGWFDLALSTEMLEHDPHWRESLRRMVELVRPEGSVVVTCAGPRRPAHEVNCAPVQHYQGLAMGEVMAQVQGCGRWLCVWAEEHTLPNDTYVAAIGKGLEAPTPKLSVIIPAVGNVALTERCIQSVRKLSRLPVEVVLVENGSKPANREALGYLDVDVFLSFDRMIGYPAAINRGVAAARGEYLCLLNNDTEMVQYGWDEDLVTTLRSTEAAVVSPVFDFVANPAQRALAAQPEQVPFEAQTLFFVGVVLRRDVFQQLGALDEGFGLGNCEDKDFCQRAVRAGGRLVIDPGVFVKHVGHATFRRLPGLMFAALLRENELRLAEKAA